MTEPEQAEYQLLNLANENAKFAIPLTMAISGEQARALERLQLREWITLIDVSVIAADPTHLFRIFRLSPDARAWLIRQRRH